MSYKPQNPVVWTEIPVHDLDKAMAFYRTVFDYELEVMDEDGMKMAMIKSEKDMEGVAGHLYVGKPGGDGSGPVIHLCVPDTVEDAMDRLVNAGGTEVSPVVTISPGRYAYALDPDGNRIGLFQPAQAS
ncbi:VOC family protein [Actibacterium sp. XHP0104]|uniref:VOC family protein n=1 Tax=Actibacterium sp. XHP0104 TaxID=2984335 RepID=UPI0021E90397|nr:VOC family protein [Actibacterium sp. XHP0104]MCV2882617.1 VOC family protein [Actibacterium sp. XHP0104]